MSSKNTSIGSHLLNFVLFNLCFFALQLGLIYSEAGNFTSLIPLPWGVYAELIATLLFQFSLYILLSILQTFLLHGVINRRWHYFSDQQWQIMIWSLTVGAILCANAYYFPLSVFGKLLLPPLTESTAMLGLVMTLGCLGFLFCNSLIQGKNPLLLIGLIPIFLFNINASNPLKSQTELPNIIILGIDSLSPETVSKQNMPFLNNLLEQSAQFTESISPLARTYPAWISILTGLYVTHHHGEENLIAKSAINHKASIVWTLKNEGYQTIYATDDRRFNSIDNEFGFEQIIGPKLGVNDAILGSYNDFPLGNLLINARASSWFFPYNYSNRASFFSYYPATFNKTLETTLNGAANNKPIFLAVHFTLAHWPYAWAESSAEELENEFSLEKRDTLYLKAIQRVDQQVASFYNYLQQQQFFNNSLVIVLSDHGEVLYHPNSRQTNYKNYQGSRPSKLAEYFKNRTATVLNKSAGHGSDILSPQQYHCVLAFQLFQKGKALIAGERIHSRIALIDIAPTILNYLNLPIPKSMDGISLLATVLNPNHQLPNRSFFIESGMFPNQDISREKAREIAHSFYEINPITKELELKANGLNTIRQQKLFGIIKGDWILARYPDEKEYISVIQNLKTGQWSDDLNSPFALTTPAELMLDELRLFFNKTK